MKKKKPLRYYLLRFHFKHIPGCTLAATYAFALQRKLWQTESKVHYAYARSSAV